MTCAACAAITALQGDHVALLVVVSKALTPDAQADQMNVLTHVLRRQVGLQPAEYRYLRLPQQDKIRDCCREAAANKLAAINPQVVLPCGNEAVELVLGRRGITQLRGQAQALAGLDCWVLPTLSPAVVLHDPSKYRVFEDDVKAAAALRSTPFTRSADEQAREITFDVITTVGEAEALAQKVRELGKATLDVETGGGKDVNAYSGGYLIAVGFGLSPDHSAIIGRDLLAEPAVRDILAALFQAENVTWIGHNFKFDSQYLRAYIGPTPGTFLQVDDTLLMRYALQGKPGDLGLKELSSLYLGAPDYEKGLKQYITEREPATDPQGKPYGKEDYARIPDVVLHQYLAYDCAYTYQLADYFWPKVVAEGYEELYRSLLIPIHHVLTEVEAVGIGVDLEYTAGKQREYRAIVTDLEARILREAKALGWERPVEVGKKGQPLKRPEGYYDFNPGSPLQVQQILYDIMGLVSPDRKNPRGTDHKILEALKKSSNHPFIENLLEHRVYGKVLGTYLEGVPRGVDPHGRIHGRFNIAGTETGRLSSSSPNLQNIPRSSRDTGKDVKEMFVAAPGYVLVQADYSQAEYRVAGVLSGDPFLTKTYAEGGDLHNTMAEALYGPNYTKEQRTKAKTCFSGDTEILTERGWVRFDQYDGKEPVAGFTLGGGHTYNPPRGYGNRWGKPTGKPPVCDGSGIVMFTRPLAFQKIENQPLVHHKDRSLDLLMTPDHDVIYIDRGGKAHKEPASTIPTGRGAHVIAAGRLASGRPVLTHPWTRVLAMVAADGSFKATQTIRLGFTRPRKIERCREVLNAAGVRYTESVTAGVTMFRFCDSEDRAVLLDYITEDKALHPHCVWSLDGAVYLAEAVHWDSHHLPPARNGQRVLFVSVVEQTVDVMQALAALSGIPSVKRGPCLNGEHQPLYGLSYRLGDKPTVRTDWKIEPTEILADVYCVQVPSGAILVRRNGKVAVMGNCNFGSMYGMSEVGLADQLGVSQSEAANILQSYWMKMPVLRAQLDAWGEEAVLTGKVSTPFGRTRHWDFRSDANAVRREAGNFPIQSVASDLLMYSLIEMHAALGMLYHHARVICTVHDSVLIEAVPEAVPHIVNAVRNIMMTVPSRYLHTEMPFSADFEVGQSWGSLHDYDESEWV